MKTSAMIVAIGVIACTDPQTAEDEELLLGPTVRIRFEGNATGEVTVAAGGNPIATCTTSCTIPVAAGTLIDVTASTPSTFGGLSGACTSAEGDCSLTTAGDVTRITAAFRKDARERWTRLFPGGPLHTAAYDGAGRLIVGGPTGVHSLSGSGTLRWSRPIAAVALATGPGNTIYVATATDVLQLDAGGIVQWTAPLPAGARGCTSLEGFAHCIAVGPAGEVVVRGSSGVSRWSADGVPAWSRALADDLEYAVAVDPAGVVSVAVLSPFTFETLDLRRFAADGTELPGVEDAGAQYHGMIAAAPSGALLASTSGHGRVDLAAGFERSVDVVSPSYVPNGVAAAASDVAWLYHLRLASQAAPWHVARFDSTGTETWSLTRPGLGFFADRGTLPLDVAGAANGNLAIAGSFYGSGLPTGWVQTFSP